MHLWHGRHDTCIPVRTVTLGHIYVRAPARAIGTASGRHVFADGQSSATPLTDHLSRITAPTAHWKGRPQADHYHNTPTTRSAQRHGRGRPRDAGCDAVKVPIWPLWRIPSRGRRSSVETESPMRTAFPTNRRGLTRLCGAQTNSCRAAARRGAMQISRTALLMKKRCPAAPVSTAVLATRARNASAAQPIRPNVLCESRMIERAPVHVRL